MSILDPTLTNLLNRYDELPVLPANAPQDYIKNNWLTTDGTLKPKTLWARFLRCFCFTHSRFKGDYKISLKQIETKLIHSLTPETSIEGVIKIAKGVFVLKKFQAYKYERKGFDRHVKWSVACSSAVEIHKVIGSLTKFREAKVASKTNERVFIKHEISNTLDRMMKGMPRSANEAGMRAIGKGSHEQRVSLVLLEKLSDAIRRVIK